MEENFTKPIMGFQPPENEWKPSIGSIPFQLAPGKLGWSRRSPIDFNVSPPKPVLFWIKLMKPCFSRFGQYAASATTHQPDAQWSNPPSNIISSFWLKKSNHVADRLIVVIPFFLLGLSTCFNHPCGKKCLRSRRTAPKLILGKLKTRL